MKDHKISINKHCPCTQSKCPIRGNCVLCIQNHIDNKQHVPECVQELLRPAIESLARHVELNAGDVRPDKEFWDDFDTKTFLRETLDKHKST